MMKKRLISLFCSALLETLAARENAVNLMPLIKNSNFSKMHGSNPAQWQCVVQPEGCKVSDTEDGRVLTLNRVDTTKPCMIVQRDLPLKRDQKYIVRCEVRSKNEGDGMIYCEWRIPLPDGKWRHSSVNAKRITAESEWKEEFFEIPIRSENSEAPYIVLSAVSGTVEFRNLTLEEKK